jgi:hypothetical protein
MVVGRLPHRLQPVTSNPLEKVRNLPYAQIGLKQAGWNRRSHRAIRVLEEQAFLHEQRTSCAPFFPSL